jgi:histidinol phosphatase-like enzyme
VTNDLAARKPQPGMLLTAVSYFQVAPTEICYVGDMASDQAAAQAAGTQFVDVRDWLSGQALPKREA